ncbi:MAG: hypothetical protein COA32_04710 [Fluviicola sp.]|nr:MAG: hypothetical protein COA32_04710 [Fluviicola sp.]
MSIQYPSISLLSNRKKNDMAKLRPFRAVRPTRDKAHLVASRPIFTYKPSILKAKLQENPFTFIHIIHPEYFEDESNKTEPNSLERFQKVKKKYEEFVERGTFDQDDIPSFYIYRQTKNDHAFLGVIAGASVEEYQNNKIKKHEATITSREEMFTNYLDIVGVNAEPVLLSHEKSLEVDEILSSITSMRAEYDFSTTDNVHHELWIASEEEVKSLQQAYDKIENVYIADGHHRSASSVRLAERRLEQNPSATGKNYEAFLSFFIDEERLQILPFHRLCKSLNGLTKVQLLEKLELRFDISTISKGSTPKNMHEFQMYIENEWFKLVAKPDVISKSDAVSSIDAEILTREVLSPILGIHDLKTDKNVGFLSGETKIKKIEQLVNKEVYKVAFLLHPATMEQVKNVADENAVMPPKSTWVEPKLRSGLTIYKIDE